MVRGKYFEGPEHLEQIRALREEIFGRELGLNCLAGLDETDAFAVQAVAFDFDDSIAGIGRITFDGKRFDISHIAIRKDLRGQEYGDFVLKMLINKAVLSNASEIHALSLPEAVGFFESVGFKNENTPSVIDGVSYENLLLSGSLMHNCCGGCH